ncbi:nitroreductase family protein [Chryseolinea lacunae]|uniref:Nitroreductase family protein n=1 Tax=Chryseolinea lacunae TaxID=2801331 RepID=A0ABS1L480_9BACT|nr:nitroreductase family protein [Chryseolinea lacunae]MBL0745747.1 nitroreductase family protein [Chryseolinea lacunae]
MQDLMTILYGRRAVRKYDDRAVETQVIEGVIDAGRMAPSAMNTQPWKFYVVTEGDLINAMEVQIHLVANDIYMIPEMLQFFRARMPFFMVHL